MHECLLTSVQKFLQYQPQFWKSVFQTADSCEKPNPTFCLWIPRSRLRHFRWVWWLLLLIRTRAITSRVTISPFLLLNLDELYSDTNMTLRGIDLQPDVGK